MLKAKHIARRPKTKGIVIIRALSRNGEKDMCKVDRYSIGTKFFLTRKSRVKIDAIQAVLFLLSQLGALENVFIIIFLARFITTVNSFDLKKKS